MARRKMAGADCAFWNATALRRERAAEILGAPIADKDWVATEQAFRACSRGIAQVPHPDAQGRRTYPDWAEQQAGLLRRTDKILALIGELSRPGSGLDAVRSDTPTAARGLHDRLASASDEILSVHIAIARAEPAVVDVATERECWRLLVVELHRVLGAAGHDVGLSGQGSFDADPDRALRPFEVLVAELGVLRSNSHAALSQWIRRALK